MDQTVTFWSEFAKNIEKQSWDYTMIAFDEDW